MYIGFQTEIHFKPTSRITTREAPYKQNYDQGASVCLYPQAELRPGNWLAGWLAGGLAGWVAEAQRRPEMPREAQRAGTWIEQACHALGWRIPGWLAEAQKDPEKPGEAQRGPCRVR